MSRAKAKVCRAVDAWYEISPTTKRTNIRTDMQMTPLLGIACWKTYRKGYPVGSFSASSMLGTEKMNATMRMKPMAPFPR